jgi:hypothetical protein
MVVDFSESAFGAEDLEAFEVVVEPHWLILVMNFLTALDRDVEIVIHRKPRRSKGGRILVTAA